MNPARRPNPLPPDEWPFNQPEGRVYLTSGWWSWGSTKARRFRDADRWIVFWHETNRSWRIQARIPKDWSGSPPVEQYAQGAMRLTVLGAVGIVREVFLLSDHAFIQEPTGDVGRLVPHDGRPLAELTEEEIERLVG